MNKLFFAGVAAVALTLSACNEQANQGTDVGDKAQDALAAPVGQASAATLGSNVVSAYVPNAAMGDMYEIMAADIALEKSGDDRIKRLAQMIKTDHTTASNEFKALVPTAAPGTEIPAALDQRRQGLIDNLRSSTPADFNRIYIDQQIAAHQEAVTLHRGFADNTDAPQLAAHAAKVLPKIEAHLREAEAIKAAMG